LKERTDRPAGSNVFNLKRGEGKIVKLNYCKVKHALSAKLALTSTLSQRERESSPSLFKRGVGVSFEITVIYKLT